VELRLKCVKKTKYSNSNSSQRKKISAGKEHTRAAEWYDLISLPAVMGVHPVWSSPQPGCTCGWTTLLIDHIAVNRASGTSWPRGQFCYLCNHTTSPQLANVLDNLPASLWCSNPSSTEYTAISWYPIFCAGCTPLLQCLGRLSFLPPVGS